MATTKVTLAGVCREALDNCARALSLAELTVFCQSAGLKVSEAQVYAGVQSMASTGKCDRGPETRTWTKLGTGRSAGTDRIGSDDAPKVRVPRGPKVEHITFPTDSVIAELVEKLGPPSTRPMDRLAHCFVLLGDWSADDIIVRTHSVLQQQPDNWFTYQQGPNVVVGFTIK